MTRSTRSLTRGGGGGDDDDAKANDSFSSSFFSTPECEGISREIKRVQYSLESSSFNPFFFFFFFFFSQAISIHTVPVELVNGSSSQARTQTRLLSTVVVLSLCALHTCVTRCKVIKLNRKTGEKKERKGKKEKSRTF